MTKEDKELLLKDLAARLPYGVKVIGTGKYPLTVSPRVYCGITNDDNINNLPKLLLRPMSSMTEEELKEFQKFRDITPLDWLPLAHDWLNAHHFDYRGLIEKGLALEAPEGMYNIKEK